MDLALKLDTASSVPLHRQLYDELRHAILSSRLESGQRVPSTRSLAKSLKVSRATVLLSYEQLLSEGYLETIPASGTFVSCQLPDELLSATTAIPVSPAFPPSIERSPYGATLATVELPPPPAPNLPTNFSCFGRPALDEFPLQLWRRLWSRSCRLGSTMLDYPTDPLGYKPLREAIACYLAQARAVRCKPDQVIIVSGSQQALDMMARLFLNPGDRVAMEDPGYFEARQIFQVNGAEVLPVSVDRSGMITDNLSTQTATPIKLVYVTPSHQFPTGAVLSLSRRLALLAWAQQTGAIILEDDYDSEFRYEERPIPALQGLTSSDLVIYIGTFSKILFPSLRIGYMVVPQRLVPLVARTRWLCDRQSPLLEQQTLTDFINEGHLESHIRRMRMLYAQRRQILIQAITQHLGNKATILGENAGMNVMVKFHTHWDDQEIIERAACRGVELISARKCYVQADSKGKFFLGFADLHPEKIQEGIFKLAQVFRQ